MGPGSGRFPPRDPPRPPKIAALGAGLGDDLGSILGEVGRPSRPLPLLSTTRKDLHGGGGVARPAGVLDKTKQSKTRKRQNNSDNDAVLKIKRIITTINENENDHRDGKTKAEAKHVKKTESNNAYRKET